MMIDLVSTACATARLLFNAASLFSARYVRVLVFVLLALIVVGFVSLLNLLFAAGVRFLYGGEDDEAIRFMEPEPVQEPVQEPASTSAMDRERELEVLRVIVGVTGANYFGTEGHRKKQFGVHLQVRANPEAERQMIRVPCSGDKPTQADAAREAKRRVAAVLGDAAVEAAERLVTERRAAAGTSASVERNVNAVLGKTQRLQALLRAAQTRATKAEVAAERAETEAAEAIIVVIIAVIIVYCEHHVINDPHNKGKLLGLRALAPGPRKISKFKLLYLHLHWIILTVGVARARDDSQLCKLVPRQ